MIVGAGPGETTSSVGLAGLFPVGGVGLGGWVDELAGISTTGPNLGGKIIVLIPGRDI